MKIYTKTGDRGETGLFGGKRVPKDDLRVAAYGEVDELNAVLGFVHAQLGDSPLAPEIRAIQSELFTLGADLATPSDAGERAQSKIRRFEPARAERLERIVDRLEEGLPRLTKFILPGGAPAAAALQVARAVCRRAERAAVTLARTEEIGEGPVVYLNRLSDLLFVMARAENHRTGHPEPEWAGPA